MTPQVVSRWGRGVSRTVRSPGRKCATSRGPVPAAALHSPHPVRGALRRGDQMSAILEAAPLHALVVDDDSIFGRRLANGLAEFGLDAIACGRSEEALEAVAKRLADVLLLSPFLPDGSGLQLIEALRSD